MKSWTIALAATVLVVIVAGAYDWKGRNAEEVQRVAARTHGSPFSERDYFARQMERWTPDDGLSVLFGFVPVGYVLAGGLALSFIAVFDRVDRNLALSVFSAIGVIGCASVVFTHLMRMNAFNEAQVAFGEWSRTPPNTAISVVTKDGFLYKLIEVKRATMLMNVGLIATAFALGYLLVFFAQRRPVVAAATKT